MTTPDPFDLDPLSEIIEARVGDEMRDLATVIVPTEPGTYLDKEGDPWTLMPDGHWYDHTGETHDTKWNYLLVASGPYTKA